MLDMGNIADRRLIEWIISDNSRKKTSDISRGANISYSTVSDLRKKGPEGVDRISFINAVKLTEYSQSILDSEGESIEDIIESGGEQSG